MLIFHRTLDRLADSLWTGRKVTLRFTADYRTACIALPLIKKLLAEGEDGETYRCSIAHWHLNERPSLYAHRGEVSTVRIDGPLQKAGTSYLPLGGLIESPGVTAHLDPVEADRLDRRVQEAVERAIRDWIVEHGLYDQPRPHREIDRRNADRAAREVIALWVTEQFGESEPVQPSYSRKGPDHV
ncbi:hypothetical protein [Sphingobium lactosutens]|uniref:hypothetical protein n=1 Tax=Sphingobium lactosutens TaxID=522773 RepID=UPI001C4A9108|nr:hypothetical protein [Sphingobium lactosutens]